MANSGPNGQQLVGSWDCLRLPVERWRAWYWDGEVRSTDDWGSLPNAVLLVYVYHQGHTGDRPRKTRMVAHDVYPPPPGVEGGPRLGYQLGEVDGPEWRAARAEIEAQS
jgi:hypothetical protein